jgi:hypothetical protein
MTVAAQAPARRGFLTARHHCVIPGEGDLGADRSEEAGVFVLESMGSNGRRIGL